MASKLTLLDAIKNRGSLHTLSDEQVISDARVQEIVSEGILHAPSPFNCQSGRAIVLIKEEHKKFWDLAHNTAKAAVPPHVFEKVFGPRTTMFRAAYGTVRIETGSPLGLKSQPLTRCFRSSSLRAKKLSTRLAKRCPWSRMPCPNVSCKHKSKATWAPQMDS